jgi:hypothetical protein
MKTTQKKLERYRRRPSQFVTAVRLKLDIDEMRFRKWGSEQRAKRGDWLVDNAGEVYTVDANTFRRTYKKLSPGVFLKKTPIWARQATQAGSIGTQEGMTRYRRGDYIVFNERDGSDGYAITRAKFRKLYVKDAKG